MIKDIYNLGYKLGEKTGAISQRIADLFPGAPYMEDRQKASFGAVPTAYVGALFTAIFGLAAIATPLSVAAGALAGTTMLNGGMLLSTAVMTTLYTGVAAFSKGMLMGADTHIGAVSHFYERLHDVRVSLFGEPKKKPTAPYITPAREQAVKSDLSNRTAAADFRDAAPRDERSGYAPAVPKQGQDKKQPKNGR